MKTLCILFATVTPLVLAPLVLAGCGGRASSSETEKTGDGTSDERTNGDAGLVDTEGEAAEDPAEGDVGMVGVAPNETNGVADVDQDGDVDELDEQLTSVSGVLDIELSDADGDGDVDVDDLVQIATNEYGVGEQELDVTGDGTFDEQDLEVVAQQIEEGDITSESVEVSSRDDAPPASAVGMVAPTPAIAGPARGVPFPPGVGGGGIPDLGSCEEEYRSAGPDYCDVGYMCDAGYMYGNCWDEGSGVLRCSCGAESDIGYGSAEYQLSEVPIADACSTLMDLCTEEVQPEFSEEPECVPEYQSASDEWCDMSLRCSQSAELEDGGTALLSEYESVSCVREDDVRQCQCYTPQGSVSFELTDAEGLDACMTALDICDSAATVETEEPAECEVELQQASQTWCDAQLACSTTATLDDVTVEIAEAASINCQLVEEGLWQCGCYPSSESSSFEFESTSSAWDTCTEAVEMCGW